MQDSAKRQPDIPVVAGIPDPILEGIANGWDVSAATDFDNDTIIEADVVIIGTGAGGGTSAEILSNAGLKVLMLEEGPLKSTNDFRMDEREAYHDLYQESAGRMSKDGSMSILQGRCVGGTTVINWTSCFRTPEPTLDYWAREFKVEGFSADDMAPWFEKMEQRLNVAPWQVPPNENNSVLAKGCTQLGIDWHLIPRNVAGCWNLGYCGTGCPTNAKQSMLVSTIPAALDNQSQLIYSARAERLIIEGNKVLGVDVTALDRHYQPSGKRLVVKASHIIMACGAINGPALLLRSDAPDPQQRIGKRTFFHPTTFCFAEFEEQIDPYYGAPQSVYVDHFQWQEVNGRVGYKLEVPPLQPGLTSVLLLGHGHQHFTDIQKLPNLQATIALLRDGFHPHSQGASIELSDDGSPIIDHEINDYLWDGVLRSWLTMAEIQFAAGAKAVRPSHVDAPWYQSWEEAQAAIPQLAFRSNAFTAGSAHCMGGLAMGEDKSRCLVNSQGKYHYLDNLYVFDGSVFPSSIGANPQLSIYGLACKQATELLETIRAGAV
ncbi:MAG: GMC family oxidoreductase [Oceanospirillaceae bacterium]|nr:GMC family oxidoreductase [Oceanospirillaceae bacterium]MBL36542.1 GMC family oxidoreductase [Oceanospirillaceae bacterium]MBS53390.1 GMC family oxidoreductase [Oceanospirillaceae bacterium]|tara:strand:+ start:470 stop:2107 length:1638 start_codon:yes stop_codon:yes gene_type:complete